MNKVWLSGNVVADAEMRVANTPGGSKSVAQLRVATNEGYGASKESEFHTVVLWEGMADEARYRAKKGVEVFVEGRIKTRSWDDKETGAKKYKTEIIARKIAYADDFENKQGFEQTFDAAADVAIAPREPVRF